MAPRCGGIPTAPGDRRNLAEGALSALGWRIRCFGRTLPAAAIHTLAICLPVLTRTWMRICVCIVLMFPALLPAETGADIYKQRCASCHDTPPGRVPSLAAIRGMGAKAIYSALTAGVMKTQAAGLSTAQIFALITYIAPGNRNRRRPLPLRRPARITTRHDSRPAPCAETHRGGTAGARAPPTLDFRMPRRRDSRQPWFPSSN